MLADTTGAILESRRRILGCDSGDVDNGSEGDGGDQEERRKTGKQGEAVS
jgi:hypothetical protein